MKNDIKGFVSDSEVLRPLLAGADHVDIKRVEGNLPLDRFVSGMLSYFPWWLRLLYLVRAVVVKILGLREHYPETQMTGFIPLQVSFQPGDTVLFFTVRLAKKEAYWIAETPEDKHLRAYLAILAQPTADHATAFFVTTIVHYKHWTGPVYFNLIRPFHHLVVSRMARAGVTNGEVQAV